MNIFIVDENPQQAARDLCSKHICKMCVESAQLLSTTIFLRSSELYEEHKQFLYKPTHKKHPCTLWASSDVHSFTWLLEHALELCNEYERRYCRVHASRRIIEHVQLAKLDLLVFGAEVGDSRRHTEFAQAMPDKYKREHNAVEAYRSYYAGEKSEFAKWEPRAREPKWWTNASCRS